MRMLRTSLLLAALLQAVAVACTPGTAFAAVTAPTLESPDVSPSGLVEGGSIEFRWTGDLQGDSSALGQSFFRIEVAASADVPDGSQSEWTNLENVMQTPAGRSSSTITMGVPAAGTYRWRVCAWGVVDADVSNEIVQLPGGCSTSRPFTTTAVTRTTTTVEKVTVTETNSVPGPVKTVTVTRPAADTPTPTPTPTEQPVEEPVPAMVAAAPTPSVRTAPDGTPQSSVKLASDGLEITRAATRSRHGITGSILGGLTATLPIVPIPYWTLAILLGCYPIARAWRRNVSHMFDWPDSSTAGSIAGNPRAIDVKAGMESADAEASIPARSLTGVFRRAA